VIGIDISDRSIKIIRLDGGRRRLLTHCWHEVPEHLIEQGVVRQKDQMAKVLQTALQKCRLSKTLAGEVVVASIPESESFLRVIDIPDMDEQEVNESVQWEVAQHIPFGIENVYVDWQWAGEGGKASAFEALADKSAGRREILVGATEKRVVDPLLELLHELKLDVAALELESQAIIRSLISPALRHQAGLLVVDLGGSATNVVIHDRGTIRFTATLRKGSFDLIRKLSSDQQKEVSGPPPEALSPNLDPIQVKLQAGLDELVVEIRGIVEFYTGLNAQHRVNEILLTGGGANLPGLDTTFLRYFDDVHIQRGDPWVNVWAHRSKGEGPLNLHESVHYATAIGLALRPVVA
jgi:type IV pilus assembly protein PilM